MDPLVFDSAETKTLEDPPREGNPASRASVPSYGVLRVKVSADGLSTCLGVFTNIPKGRISGYKISYPVFLDVEGSGGRGDAIDSATRTAVCKAFCNTIKNAGYTPGVYANKTWLTSKMDAGALSGYKIWLAQYAKTPTYTGRYDLWQYRSDGKVSGISGKVDLNISYLGY